MAMAAVMALPAVLDTASASGDDEAWARQFGTGGLDEATAVVVDGEGSAYVAGETFGTLTGQTPAGTLDAFVRKYDRAGREVWTRQFGAWERDIAWGMAIDRRGPAYVVGQTEGSLPAQQSAGGWDGFVRKYDSSGAELWTRQFGGRGADIAAGAVVDPGGDLYVVGTTSSALPGQEQAGSFDAFLRRYDGEGREVWTRQFGTAAGDNARRVAIAPDGRVLVVGSTEGALAGASSAGGFDAYVSTFWPDGRQLSIGQFGSGGDDFGMAIGADRRGHISVAGRAGRALPGGTAGRIFLRHFDAHGTALWTHQFGAGQSEDAWDVAVDSAGDAYLVGTTAQGLPGQHSTGRLDAFVRRYSVDGGERATRQFGTTEDDHALAVAVDGRTIVVAGSTRGAMSSRPAGELDAFVSQMTMSGTP